MFYIGLTYPRCGDGCGYSHSSVASLQDWLGGGLVTEGRKIHKVSEDFVMDPKNWTSP
jgi:hypothetical protein